MDIEKLLEGLTQKEKDKILSKLQSEKTTKQYEENLEKIKNNKIYIGKYFKHNDEYFCIIDSKSVNEYHLACFGFEFPPEIINLPKRQRLFTPDLSFGEKDLKAFFVEDKPLLCLDSKKLKECTEISKEEFLQKMDEYYLALKEILEKEIERNKNED